MCVFIRFSKKTTLVMEGILVPLPKFIYWSPDPQRDGIQRWGSERQSGLDEVMVMGLPWWDSYSYKKRRTRPLHSSLNHVRTQKAANYKPGRWSSPEPNHAGTLTSDLPTSRTVTNKWLLFHQPSLGCFVRTLQADQDITSLDNSNPVLPLILISLFMFH